MKSAPLTLKWPVRSGVGVSLFRTPHAGHVTVQIWPSKVGAAFASMLLQEKQLISSIATPMLVGEVRRTRGRLP